MTCVVCGGAVGEPMYANAWEKTRKVSACCSAACAQSFDPDQHWIPSSRAGERLRKEDRPSVVVRDLLLSGVGLPAIRKLVSATKLGSESTNVADMLPVQQRGWVGRLIYGAARAAAPDPNEPDHVDAANADLDRWAKHFA